MDGLNPLYDEFEKITGQKLQRPVKPLQETQPTNQQQGAKTVQKTGGLDVPAILDDELAKRGWSPNARMAIIANVGRENDWNPNTIFSEHIDPASNTNGRGIIRNRGIISWNNERRTAMENYVRKNGGDFTPNENNLRLQAQFLDQEARTGRWGNITDKISNQNLAVDDYYPVFQKYILYQKRYESDNKRREQQLKARGFTPRQIQQIQAGNFDGLAKDFERITGQKIGTQSQTAPQSNLSSLANEFQQITGQSLPTQNQQTAPQFDLRTGDMPGVNPQTDNSALIQQKQQQLLNAKTPQEKEAIALEITNLQGGQTNAPTNTPQNNQTPIQTLGGNDDAAKLTELEKQRAELYRQRDEAIKSRRLEDVNKIRPSLDSVENEIKRLQATGVSNFQPSQNGGIQPTTTNPNQAMPLSDSPFEGAGNQTQTVSGQTQQSTQKQVFTDLEGAEWQQSDDQSGVDKGFVRFVNPQTKRTQLVGIDENNAITDIYSETTTDSEYENYVAEQQKLNNPALSKDEYFEQQYQNYAKSEKQNRRTPKSKEEFLQLISKPGLTKVEGYQMNSPAQRQQAAANSDLQAKPTQAVAQQNRQQSRKGVGGIDESAVTYANNTRYGSKLVKTDGDFLGTVAGTVNVDVTKKPAGMDYDEYFYRSALQALGGRYGITAEQINNAVAAQRQIGFWQDNKSRNDRNSWRDKNAKSLSVTLTFDNINRAFGGSGDTLSAEVSEARKEDELQRYVLRKPSQMTDIPLEEISTAQEDAARRKTQETIDKDISTIDGADYGQAFLGEVLKSPLARIGDWWDGKGFLNIQGFRENITIPRTEAEFNKARNTRMGEVLSEFGSFSNYQRTMGSIDGLDYANRVYMNYWRGVINTAVSSNLKGLDAADALIEKISPFTLIGNYFGKDSRVGNFLRDYNPSLRNFENLVNFSAAAISGRTDRFQLMTQDAPVADRMFYTLGQGISDTLGEDKTLRRDTLGMLANSFGSATGFFILGILAPSSNIGKGFLQFSPTSAAFGALGHTGEMYSQAKQKGLSEEEARFASLAGVPLGALEGFGAGAILGKALNTTERRTLLSILGEYYKTPAGRAELLKAGRRNLLEKGKTFLTEGGEEFIQETGQGVGENTVWKYLEEKDKSLFEKLSTAYKNVPALTAKAIREQGLVAGLTGGLFGVGVNSVVNRAMPTDVSNDGTPQINYANNSVVLNGQNYTFANQDSQVLKQWMAAREGLESVNRELSSATGGNRIRLEKEEQILQNREKLLREEVFGVLTPSSETSGELQNGQTLFWNGKEVTVKNANKVNFEGEDFITVETADGKTESVPLNEIQTNTTDTETAPTTEAETPIPITPLLSDEEIENAPKTIIPRDGSQTVEMKVAPLGKQRTDGETVNEFFVDENNQVRAQDELPVKQNETKTNAQQVAPSVAESENVSVPKANLPKVSQVLGKAKETGNSAPVNDTLFTPLRESVNSLDDSVRGKKQLNRALNNIDDVLKQNNGQIADDKTAVKVLSEINRINMNLASMGTEADTIRQQLKPITDSLRSQGYEIADLLGQEYDGGMNIIGSFEPKEGLEIGEERIIRIIKPQVTKNGKMIQTGEVVVGYNENTPPNYEKPKKQAKETGEASTPKPKVFRQSAKPTAKERIDSAFVPKKAKVEAQSENLATKTFYRGMSQKRGQFAVNEEGGIFFSDKSDIAELYKESEDGTGEVAQVNLVMRNPKTIQGDTSKYTHNYKQEIEQAKSEGYDSLIIRNTRDLLGGIQDQYVVFSAEQVKSKSQPSTDRTQKEGGKSIAKSDKDIPQGEKSESVKPSEQTGESAKTQTETNNDIEKLPISQQVKVEDIDGVDFTRAEVAKSVKTENINDKTGFTETQTEWFVKEIQDLYDNLDAESYQSAKSAVEAKESDLAQVKKQLSAFRRQIDNYNQVIQFGKDLLQKLQTGIDDKTLADDLYMSGQFTLRASSEFVKKTQVEQIAFVKKQITSLEKSLTDVPAEIAKGEAKVVKAESELEQAEAEKSKVPNIIKVPGDGTFTFYSKQGIDAIHKKLTGKTVEEFRASADKTFRPKSELNNADKYRRETARPNLGKTPKQKQNDIALEQRYIELLQQTGVIDSNDQFSTGNFFEIDTDKDRVEIEKRIKKLEQQLDSKNEPILQMTSVEGEINLASLYDEKGNVNYEKTRDVARRIESGELAIERLGESGEQGRIKGGRRNVEASIILAGKTGTSQSASTNDGTRLESHSDTIKRQEQILEKYAKDNDIWFKQGHFPSRLYVGRGGEANVYEKDANRVVKLIDYRHIDRSMTPQKFLDNRISLFNALFPETHYELMGFMRDEQGKFRVIVTQSFIEGEGSRTQSDIDSMMEARGFERTGRESYSNALYQVHDLHIGNTIKDDNGNVFVIDAVPKFNTKTLPMRVFNRGSFSETEDSILQMTSVDEQNTFFSQLARTIEQKMPNRASAEQIRGILTNPNNQVKQEEYNWLGMDEFLSEKDTFTKQEVLDFVEANNVQIEEVVKKSEVVSLDFERLDDYDVNDFLFDTNSYFDYSDANEAIEKVWEDDEVGYRILQDFNDIYYAFDNYGREILPLNNKAYFDSFDEAKKATEDDLSKDNSDTKFSQYQLEGEKENYRELLLTMPLKRKQSFSDFIAQYKERFPNSKSSEFEIRKMYDSGAAIPLNGSLVADAPPEVYKSSHFDEPNILVHIRTNDRLVPVESLSDFPELQKRLRDEGRTHAKVLFGEENQADKGQEWRDLKNKIAEGTADAEDIKRFEFLDENFPFNDTQSWAQLGFRAMLRKAAEGNYDLLAWTTGAQQIDRYETELRKNIDELKWTKRGDKVNINGVKGGETVFDEVFNIEGKTQFKGENVTLDAVLGKDIARQIRESDNSEHSIEGNDLSIGGQLHKLVYDKMMPSYAKKYGKKWGAKVGTAKIGTSINNNGFKEAQEIASNQIRWEESLDPNNEMPFDESTFEERLAVAVDAMAEYNGTTAQTVRAVTITDKMRDSVMQGQPLFHAASEELKQALKDASRIETDELIRDFNPTEDFISEGNAVEFQSAASYEIVRRVLNDAEGRTMKWDGLYLTKAQTARLVRKLRELAKFAQSPDGLEMSVKEANKVNKTATLFENIANANDGTLMLFVTDEARAHEGQHALHDKESGYKGHSKFFSKARLEKLASMPAIQKLLSGYYKDANPAEAVEEAFTYIAQNQLKDLNNKQTRSGGEAITKDEAVEFATEWLWNFHKNNEGANIDNIINNFARASNYYEQIKQRKEKVFESRSVKRANPQRESGGADNRRTSETNERDVESANQANDGEADNGRIKKSKTPQTLRENGIEIGDRFYTGTTNAEQQAFANKQLDKGVDEAQKWLDTAADDGAYHSGATTAVALSLMNHYGKTGDIEALNKVADQIVPMLTEAGQAIQAMSLVSVYNPETAGTYAAKVKKQKTGKDLSRAEHEKAVRIATELSETAKADGISQALLDKANEAIAELAEENKVLEQTAAILENDKSRLALKLDDAAKTIRNLKAKIKRLKDGKQGKKRTQPLNKLYKELASKRADLENTVREAFAGAGLKMVAWHGSPHRFDKFDISKIGTGEGNQSYGYGLYFASKEEIADWYKQKLSSFDPDILTVKGVKFNDILSNAIKKQIEAYLNGNVFASLDVVNNSINQEIYFHTERIAEDMGEYWDSSAHLKQLEQLKGVADSDIKGLSGVKYKVDLKPSEDEYLLWDEPVPQDVVNKVAQGLDDSKITNFAKPREFAKTDGTVISDTSHNSGLLFYKYISKTLGSDKAASEYLKSLGIRGIKYLDGTSRGKGEGSFNYVIFDDADVEIEAILKMARPATAPKEAISALEDLTVLNILDGKTYAEVIEAINEQSNNTLTDEEVAEIHSKAVATIKGDGKTLTEEQRTKAKIRNEHYRRADNFDNRFTGEINATIKKIAESIVADSKDSKAVNQFTKIILTHGVEGNFSDEAIYAALARKRYAPDEISAQIAQEFPALSKAEIRKAFADSTEIYNRAKAQIERLRIMAAENTKVGEKAIDRIIRERKTNDVAKRNIARETRNFYDALGKSGLQVFVETFVNYTRANLLSAPITHEVNIASNVVNATAEEFERTLGSMIDGLIGLKSHQRSLQGMSLKGVAKAFEAIYKADNTSKSINKESGLSEAYKIMLYGDSAEHLSKLQLSESNLREKFNFSYAGTMIDGYINFVFRAMGAEDAIFKAYAFRRSLEEQAEIMAKNANRRDKSVDVKARKKQLLEKPTNVMQVTALDFALDLTYQNDNWLETNVTSKLKGAGWGAKAVTELIVPFTRTPTNILIKTLERSPFGFIKAGILAYKFAKRPESAVKKVNEQYREAVTKDLMADVQWDSLTENGKRRLVEKQLDKIYSQKLQREVSGLLSRATVGTAGYIALGYILASIGVLAGAMNFEDDDKDETNEYFDRMRKGIDTGSINIPGVGRFRLVSSPQVVALTAGATIFEQQQLAQKQKKGAVEATVDGITETTTEAFFSHPLLKESKEMFASNQVMSSRLGNYAGRIVPLSSLVRQISEVTDNSPRKKSTFKPKYGNKPVDQLQAFRQSFFGGIPGLRTYNPVSTSGVSETERGGWLRRLGRMFDLTNYRSPNAERPKEDKPKPKKTPKK